MGYALSILGKPGEPAVIPCLEQPLSAGGYPSPRCRVAGVELGNVGLDIEERRAVNNVHVLYVQDITFDPDQAHDGQANGVGPAGGASGEDAMLGIVQEGLHHQGHAPGPVEVVQHR